MKLSFAVVLSSALVAGPAYAQHHDHSGHVPAAMAASPAGSQPTDGTVQKIDKGAGKITLKHGEIKNLGMPPMTMVFRVKDAALLDKVRVGENVTFHAEQPDAGAYTVTAIDPVR